MAAPGSAGSHTRLSGALQHGRIFPEGARRADRRFEQRPFHAFEEGSVNPRAGAGDRQCTEQSLARSENWRRNSGCFGITLAVGYVATGPANRLVGFALFA